MKPIIIGSVVLTLLSVAAAAAPSLFPFLPLGGSPIAQMGIVLGVSVAIENLAALFRGGRN